MKQIYNGRIDIYRMSLIENLSLLEQELHTCTVPNVSVDIDTLKCRTIIYRSLRYVEDHHVILLFSSSSKDRITYRYGLVNNMLCKRYTITTTSTTTHRKFHLFGNN